MNIDELYDILYYLREEGHGKRLILTYDGEDYVEAEEVSPQHPIDWIKCCPDKTIINGFVIK